MSGFDGAMTTHSASAIASSTPGAGLASSAPSKRMARTGTECCRCTKYSWKPISVGRPSSPSMVSMVRSRSSVAGSRRELEPPTGRDLGGDLRERRALAPAGRAVEVGAEVAVAEVEPRGAAEPSERLHRLPRLAGQAPAPLGVDLAGERVGDRVEIGADRQAVQLDVVADVDDGGDLVGRADLHEAGQEAGCADAARDDRDHRGHPTGGSVSPRRRRWPRRACSIASVASITPWRSRSMSRPTASSASAAIPSVSATARSRCSQPR